MVLYESLSSPSDIKSVEVLSNHFGRLFSRDQCKKTYHEFEFNLEPELKTAFENLRQGDLLKLVEKEHPSSEIIPIVNMNEVYVACLGADGSDMVFETLHLDGPFALLPFCTVYRCLICIQGNMSVTTSFPLARKSHENITLKTNDMIAFDYNREPHFISNNGSAQDLTPRIVLKIHYAVTPKGSLPVHNQICSTSNANYNSLARKAFLSTQNPESVEQQTTSFAINSTTTIYGLYYMYIGWFNLFAVLAIAYLYYSQQLQLFPYLVYLITIIYHVIYISEYSFRTVPLAEFRRDAVTFRLLAWGILFTLCSPNVYSSIIACIGFALTFASFWQLGPNLTYFSRELNELTESDKQRKVGFPYGYIPHPMIVGDIISISALLITPCFWNNWYPLIMLHIVAYMFVLFQEISQVHISSNKTFQEIYNHFAIFHKSKGNIWTHVLTTFIGFVGLFGLFAKYSSYSLAPVIYIVVAFLYRYSIGYEEIAHISAIFVTFAFLVAKWLTEYLPQDMSMYFFFSAVIIAILGQEASHLFFKETTMMADYISSKDATTTFMLHTFWLVPLLVKRVLEY